MKNQFTVKIKNGNLHSKFYNCEDLITKVYLKEDGTKYKDTPERKLRFQKKKAEIEKNVIVDLYDDFRWESNRLIQEPKISKFLPDFKDENTNTFFEIINVNPYFYSDNEETMFKDRKQHIIALLNQKIYNSENTEITEKFSDHLYKNIENAIEKKSKKYKEFPKKINLIVYCILQDIEMNPRDVLWVYNNEEKFIQSIKQSVKSDQKLLNFKWNGANKIFNKIYLCFKSMIDGNKYYDISLVIGNY